MLSQDVFIEFLGLVELKHALKETKRGCKTSRLRWRRSTSHHAPPQNGTLERGFVVALQENKNQIWKRTDWQHLCDSKERKSLDEIPKQEKQNEMGWNFWRLVRSKFSIFQYYRKGQSGWAKWFLLCLSHLWIPIWFPDQSLACGLGFQSPPDNVGFHPTSTTETSWLSSSQKLVWCFH